MAYQHRYEYVTSAERLGHIANEIHRTGHLALDLETTPKPEFVKRPGAAFSPFYGRSRLCSINTLKGVYVIDRFKTGGLGPIRDALHNPNAETGTGRPVVIGQNLKFDQRYLLHEDGIELWPVFDTFIGSAILHNGRGMGHNLWDIQRRELGILPQVEDLGGSDWSGELSENQLDYAADDVVQLPRIRDSLKPKLAASGLNRVALIEFGAILPACHVELNGFPLDSELWLKLAAETKVKRDALSKELLRDLPNPYGQLALPGAFDWMDGPDIIASWADSAASEMLGEEYADMEENTRELRRLELQAQIRRSSRAKGRKKDKTQFNLGSNDQLLLSLHRLDPRLQALEDTAEASLAMQAAEFPQIRQLLKYRESATRLKSFGPDYLENLNPITGRIHANYYPLLVTGRYAHREPNLGQIPRDKAFRKCFRPKKGRKFTLVDYSMVEIVIMAELTGDRTLCRLLREGKDIHRYVASKIANKAEEDVTKEERQQAKPADFGFIYGLGAEKFVSYALTGYGVVFTLQKATEIRNTFFSEFGDLADWQEETLARGKRTLQSRSIAGRIRYTNTEAHNEYLNNPDQATGADILKTALRTTFFRLRKELGTDVKLVHHVHDEIISEHDDDPELERLVQKHQSEAMVEAAEQFIKKVPCKAEPASGYSWADKG